VGRGLASAAPSRPPRLDRARMVNLSVIGVRGVNSGILTGGEHEMLRPGFRKPFSPLHQGFICQGIQGDKSTRESRLDDGGRVRNDVHPRGMCVIEILREIFDARREGER